MDVLKLLNGVLKSEIEKNALKGKIKRRWNVWIWGNSVFVVHRAHIPNLVVFFDSYWRWILKFSSRRGKWAWRKIRSSLTKHWATLLRCPLGKGCLVNVWWGSQTLEFCDFEFYYSVFRLCWIFFSSCWILILVFWAVLLENGVLSFSQISNCVLDCLAVRLFQICFNDSFLRL